MVITFAFLQIDGICFVRVHSLSMSRSQDLALLPICCRISVSTSSTPAAFPGFSKLRPVASSSRLKGLVSSVGGWLLLGTIVLWCSPGGLRCSTLLPLDNSWLAIWSAESSSSHYSHFYVGSMYDDIGLRLQVARYVVGRRTVRRTMLCVAGDFNTLYTHRCG